MPTNGIPINGAGSANGHAPTHNGTAAVTNSVATAPRPDTAGKPDLRQKAQPPLPPRPAGSRLKSTVSLTAQPITATDATSEEQTQTLPTRPDKPFSLEDLQDVWSSFSRMRRQQNDSASEQLVLNRALTIDGTTIHLTLDNTLQVGFLNDVKQDLLTYLRSELQNSQIQLEHTVTVQEVKKMIYSSQDKYNYLAEKNPALHELRKVLNLEVDY